MTDFCAQARLELPACQAGAGASFGHFMGLALVLVLAKSVGIVLQTIVFIRLILLWAQGMMLGMLVPGREGNLVQGVGTPRKAALAYLEKSLGH